MSIRASAKGEDSLRYSDLLSTSQLSDSEKLTLAFQRWLGTSSPSLQCLMS